jgi:soluble lytic murein transglycosylase-like protein
MSLIKILAWLLGLGFVLIVLETLLSDLRQFDPTERPHHDLVSAAGVTDRYDDLFRKHTRTQCGRMPWQWFKAQALQESRTLPRAQSPVGAMGLMQVIPATFEEIRKELGLANRPYDPSVNIRAGIYYDLKCYRFWTEDRTMKEKLRLMFASYNAGPGNILNAQKVVRGRNLCSGVEWECIKQGLPSVTGSHSKETIQYVERVEGFYEIL